MRHHDLEKGAITKLRCRQAVFNFWQYFNTHEVLYIDTGISCPHVIIYVYLGAQFQLHSWVQLESL